MELNETELGWKWSRKFRDYLPLAVVLAGLVVGIMQCVAPQADQKVLLPAVRGAWPDVRAEVDRGAAPLEDLLVKQLVQDERGDMDRAVLSGLTTDFDMVNWALLDLWARRGVEAEVAAGEISALVAPSLFERIKNLGEAVKALQSEPVVIN